MPNGVKTKTMTLTFKRYVGVRSYGSSWGWNSGPAFYLCFLYHGQGYTSHAQAFLISGSHTCEVRVVSEYPAAWKAWYSVEATV